MRQIHFPIVGASSIGIEVAVDKLPIGQGFVSIIDSNKYFLSHSLIGLVDGRKPAGIILCLALGPDLGRLICLGRIGIYKIEAISPFDGVASRSYHLFGLSDVMDSDIDCVFAGIGLWKADVKLLPIVFVGERNRSSRCLERDRFYIHKPSIEKEGVGGIKPWFKAKFRFGRYLAHTPIEGNMKAGMDEIKVFLRRSLIYGGCFRENLNLRQFYGFQI